MNNRINSGGQIRYTAGSDIAVGAVVDLTSQIGIAVDAITSGEAGILEIDGLFTIAKDNSLVISQGDLLYWDSGNTELDKTALNQTYAGIAESDAAETATTVDILINRMTKDRVTS